MKREEWIDEFLILYTDEDTEKFTKALELKEKHLPVELYRYRSLNTQEQIDNVLNEITKGEIYMAKPDVMNDPFDSCSMFQIENLKRTKKFKTLFLPPEKITSALAIANNSLLKEFEDLNRFWNNRFHSTARIACFTESWTNLPMWNHYASAHKGVCIEYTMSNLEDVLKKSRLLPVKYVSSLPDIISDVAVHSCKSDKIIEYFLIHKLEDWSYEKEWRLILKASDWYFYKKDVPEDFWDKGKVEKFMLPSKIYLGYKICKAYEKLFCKVCKPLGIEVYKMMRTESGLLPVACKDDEDYE